MNWFKGLWSDFTSTQTNKRLAAVTLIWYAALLIVYWLLETRLSPQIPLFYSLPKGVEQLGTPNHVKQILVGTGLLIFLDTAIAILLAKSWKNLTLITLWSAFMVVALLTITLFRIYLLVT